MNLINYIHCYLHTVYCIDYTKMHTVYVIMRTMVTRLQIFVQQFHYLSPLKASSKLCSRASWSVLASVMAS